MKSITTLIAICFGLTAFSQQEPQTTMFWNNYVYFNPAMSGLNYRHEGNLTGRSQSPGMAYHPVTLMGGYHAKVDALHGGIGVTAMTEQSSYYSGSKVLLNYSFQIRLGEESVLAIGAAAGIFKIRTQFAKLTYPELTTFQGYGTGIAFTSNFGLAYHFRDLNVGASITNLNAPTFKSEIYNVQAARNYWFFADYLFHVSKNISLKPAVVYQTDGIMSSASASLRGILKNKYWLGVNVRSRDSFGAMIGVDLNEKFRIGYAYEVTNSRLNNSVALPTHEFTLGILIN